MATQVGALSNLVFYDESTWGVKPGSPAYKFLPVDSYGVKFKAENRQSTQFTGLLTRKHSKNWRGMPAGQIVCPFWPWYAASDTKSLAQRIMEFACDYANPQSVDLPSWGTQWAEGPDVSNFEHNGLRCNQFTLAGDEDSGVIISTMDVMGKSEAALATAQTIPADMEKLVNMEFADCTLTFDGGSALDFGGFQFTQANALKTKYLNSTSPKLLKKTDRDLKLTLKGPKLGTTWDAAIRALGMDEHSIVLTMKGLHNGSFATGDYTLLTLTFNRASLVDAPDELKREDITYQPLSFNILKPDTSSDAITVAWTNP